MRLPLAFLLLRTADLGLTCAWIPMASDLFTRGMIALFYYRKGTWLKSTGTGVAA